MKPPEDFAKAQTERLVERGPYYEGGGIVLHLGDCLDVMRGLDAASVDAVVTDPPYGLEFMGKEWDRLGDVGRDRSAAISGSSFEPHSATGGADLPRITRSSRHKCAQCGLWSGGTSNMTCSCPTPAWLPDSRLSRAMQTWHEAWAREALRVLKPGGHLLAFGGSRTDHRLACGIEDAGFEVRGGVTCWLYGTGFPKSADVSKALDRAAGAEREATGKESRRPNPRAMMPGGDGLRQCDASTRYGSPVTPEAAEWDGWGTALKPSAERVVMARRPLDGTVAANVLKYGTGAINVDGCRLARAEGDTSGWHESGANGTAGYQGTGTFRTRDMGAAEIAERCRGGRWPADTVIAHHPGCVEVGTRRVRCGVRGGAQLAEPGNGGTMGDGWAHRPSADPGVADPDGMETVAEFRCHKDCWVRVLDEQAGDRSAGGAPSRRFTPKTEHTYNLGFGLDCPPGIGGSEGPASRFFFTPKADKAERFLFCSVCNAARPASERRAHRHGKSDWSHVEEHPTVKPLELMRWLVRLVTPPGGLLLDPFAGTGTTLAAARAEGFRVVGVEQRGAYCALAKARLAGVDPALDFGP